MTKRTVLRRLCAAAVTCACAACLALPCAASAAADARLLSAAAVRPEVPGALSSRGRALDTAYALYRKRQLSGAAVTAAQQPAEADGTAALLCEKAQALVDAGVLDAQTAPALPDGALWATQCAQDGLAEAALMQCGQAAALVSAQWLEPGGPVTAFATSTPAHGEEADEMLRAYRTYLGLDALDDWQPVAPDGFSDGGAALWSAEGQVYVYCTAGPDGVRLGAASLSPQEAAQYGAAGNISEKAAG